MMLVNLARVGLMACAGYLLVRDVRFRGLVNRFTGIGPILDRVLPLKAEALKADTNRNAVNDTNLNRDFRNTPDMMTP